MASVNLVTRPVNAVPMTTATARSTMLPRARNFLNPFNTLVCLSLLYLPAGVESVAHRPAPQWMTKVTVCVRVAPARVWAAAAGSATNTTRSLPDPTVFGLADTSTTTAPAATIRGRA